MENNREEIPVGKTDKDKLIMQSIGRKLNELCCMGIHHNLYAEIDVLKAEGAAIALIAHVDVTQGYWDMYYDAQTLIRNVDRNRLLKNREMDGVLFESAKFWADVVKENFL